MRIVKASPSRTIDLGRLGEMDVTQVVFDLAPFIETYGNGIAQLAVKLPESTEVYNAPLQQQGTEVRWTVGPEWLTKEGFGKAQLSWVVDGTLAKSEIYATYVGTSLTSGEGAPAPYEGYLEQVQQAGAEALAAAGRAEAGAESAEKTAKEVEAVKEAAVKETTDIKTQTQTLADNAKASAQASAGSAAEAAGYRDAAQQIAVNVAALRNEAQQAAAGAEASKNAAAGLAGAAETFARDAALSEGNAETYAAEAKNSAEESEAHKDTALAALDALLLVDTVTGEGVTTEAAAAMPLRSLTVNDGTEVQTVSVMGKNLLYFDSERTFTNIGLTATWDPEAQEVTLNGTTTAPGDLQVLTPLGLKWVPGRTYAVSVRPVGGSAVLADGSTLTFAWGIFESGANRFIRGSTAQSDINAVYSFTGKAFELAANRSDIFYFQCWRKGSVFNNFRLKVQLEEGLSVTEWEAARQQIVPLADYKTLMLDKGYNNIVTTPPADITVEYVQDTKLYFDARFAEMQAAIVAMGGNV